MVTNFNYLKLRSLDSLSLVIYPTYRFPALAASDRVRALGKITSLLLLLPRPKTAKMSDLDQMQGLRRNLNAV